MPKNTMQDLSNHLFETLELLKDTEKPLDTTRAQQINKTAQTIINLGKLEVAFIEATGDMPESNLFSKRLSAESDNGKDKKKLVAHVPQLSHKN